MTTTQITTVRFNNNQVLVAAESLPVDCRIRISRLRYLPSLLKYASPIHLRFVFHQLSCSSSWASMVVGDFVWMWNNIPTLYETYPDPSSDLAFWLQSICVDSVAWFGFVKRAERVMFRTSRSGPVEVDDVAVVPGAFGAGAHGEYTCVECQQHFASHTELLSHRRHRHGYVNPFRRLVRSSVCLSCQLDFHTIRRAFTHVAYVSKRCSRFHVQHAVPMTDDEFAQCTAKSPAQKRGSCKELLKPPMPVVAESVLS